MAEQTNETVVQPSNTELDGMAAGMDRFMKPTREVIDETKYADRPDELIAIKIRMSNNLMIDEDAKNNVNNNIA